MPSLLPDLGSALISKITSESRHSTCYESILKRSVFGALLPL